MAGRTPYSWAKTDSLVIKAIMQSKTPASTVDPLIPGYGQTLLRNCWSQEPALRPTMAWCAQVLAGRSSHCAPSPRDHDDVSDDLMSERVIWGTDWEAVVYSNTGKEYDFDFSEEYDDISLT